ncbi:hypothetical protein CSA56_12650 [candidate division KSB3 bacterium]|uniref:Uncharacterized protein n=1 Tax=candidate division KSB3 bacterium TaxID=2044937 RepID=A0A2G6KBW7_9BACT|nr:MAG: hypothetical protein CSA56_12650 [candidate division KSB3 bacterium]
MSGVALHTMKMGSTLEGFSVEPMSVGFLYKGYFQRSSSGAKHPPCHHKKTTGIRDKQGETSLLMGNPCRFEGG